MSDLADALDAPALIARHDPSGFHALLRAQAEQARAAWRLGMDWPLPASYRRPSRVVLVGMGGSAIGADIVATLARLHGRVPVEVVRHYDPPPCDPDTLVIASSFSGNTEETLSAFAGTLALPGMRLALTTGGRLIELARAHEVPLLTFAWDGPPRTAIGFGMLPVLALLSRLGAIDLDEAAVLRMVDGLAEVTAQYDTARAARDGNEAKQLAARIGTRLPVIIGADFLEVAARRFAAEVGENAKQWGFCAALPEFNHNTVEALDSPAGVPEAIVPIFLDAPAVHPRVRVRVTETARLMTERGRAPLVIDAGGATPIEAIARACALASWTSFYLAMARGVDPLPVAALDTLKARLMASQDGIAP